MRRYQQVKAGGGLLFALLFAGWLFLQGSNPVMRWIIAGLLVLTLLITFASILEDRRRVRGRQLLAEPGRWMLERDGTRTVIDLRQVAEARWRHDETAHLGLWLHDARGRPIARIDPGLVGDEEEARRFLGWARGVSGLPFPVRWPDGTRCEPGPGAPHSQASLEGTSHA